MQNFKNQKGQGQTILPWDQVALLEVPSPSGRRFEFKFELRAPRPGILRTTTVVQYALGGAFSLASAN